MTEANKQDEEEGYSSDEEQGAAAEEAPALVDLEDMVFAPKKVKEVRDGAEWLLLLFSIIPGLLLRHTVCLAHVARCRRAPKRCSPTLCAKR